MAQFSGVYPAPALAVASCGILSVANCKEHTHAKYDERWERGFSYKFNSRPTVRIVTVNDQETDGSGEIHATSVSTPRYGEYIPFFIEVEDFRSAFDVLAEDRFELVLTQLEAASQKAVERELWTGTAARAENNGNIYLTKTGGATVITTGSSYTPQQALARLEQAIISSPTGAPSVIHMTRDVATMLGTSLEYKDGCVCTRLGTQVVVGLGYSGTGPIGHANVSETWMFATGPIDVHLGKCTLVDDRLSAGFSGSLNDMRIKAFRTAAVYFDPSVFYTVRVNTFG